jgi:hypothetical protein
MNPRLGVRSTAASAARAATEWWRLVAVARADSDFAIPAQRSTTDFGIAGALAADQDVPTRHRRVPTPPGRWAQGPVATGITRMEASRGAPC